MIFDGRPREGQPLESATFSSKSIDSRAVGELSALAYAFEGHESSSQFDVHRRLIAAR